MYQRIFQGTRFILLSILPLSLTMLPKAHALPATATPGHPGDTTKAAAHAGMEEGKKGAVPARGEALFNSNCAACHNFQQKAIGPNLAGVTQRVSTSWLRNFIRDPQGMIEKGDARGRALFKQYNQYMPSFQSLTAADLNAIIAFLGEHKESPKTTSKSNLPIVKDPLPAPIAPSGFTLDLREIAQAPATSANSPKARINQTRILKGSNGVKERLFIQDLNGLIYEMAGDSLKTFMDIRKERPGFVAAPGLATGFGSFAFHPDFQKNGFFYTSHTEKAKSAQADFALPDSIKGALQWVVTEWKVEDPNAAVFKGTGREVLRVDLYSSIHGGQEITFNPTARPGEADYGLLYLGIGDAGAAESKRGYLCNSTRTIWSSVLRIDPLGRNSKNGQYGIPATNPYASGRGNALPEIYCRGFRNPNRITWAPDGKMIISDIGFSNIEEVNIGKPGADYGWPAREGTFLLDYQGRMDNIHSLPANDKDFKFTYPVAQYDHDEGNAISGGFVYTGKLAPELKGLYIFADVVRGRVFVADTREMSLGKQTRIREVKLNIDGTPTSFQQTTGSKKADLRIGLGENNEILFFTKIDGKIYRLEGCKTVSK